MRKIKYVLILITLAVGSNLYAQTYDTLKIMTYNLLNYDYNTSRNIHFQKIIQSSNPDIIVAQEVISQSGADNFLNNVLNVIFPGMYNLGTFIDGPDTDNAIFFKSSMIQFIRNKVIKTTVRDINEFTVLPNFSHDTLRIYSVHLKAGSGITEQQTRSREVDSLRKVTNSLPSGKYFLVLGDFNIYSADEMAYQKLKQVSAEGEGHLNDPLNMPGIWNQSSYAAYHTQSPRTRSFGGGATGGMDDRFDMILFSTAVKNPGGIEYLENTTTAYGNDGFHYNDSINKAPNYAVTQEVANAIHYASDHLPVYALFKYQVFATSISHNASFTENGYILYPNYPNPFNPSTNITFSLPFTSSINLKVFNSTGQEIKSLFQEKNLPAGKYSQSVELNGFPSGVYFLQLEAVSENQNKKVQLSRKLMLVK